MINIIRDLLAKKLKEFRLKNKFSVYTLGKAINKSPKTISAWEHGRGQPDADMLIKLCELYSLSSVGELFSEPPRFKNSPDDILLLSSFAMLSETDKDKILHEIKRMTEMQKYKDASVRTELDVSLL